MKWRAVSSASSTTQAERFCFWHLTPDQSRLARLMKDSLSLEDLFLDRPCGLESVHKAYPTFSCYAPGIWPTDTLSSARLAKHEPRLAGRWQGSNPGFDYDQCWTVTRRKRPALTGSNNISLFAPIRLMPHPPALELSKKTKSEHSGSLNLATVFERLLTFMVPSSRT